MTLRERGSELRQMREAVREVASGRGALLHIGGPAGAGRTALARALVELAAAEGALVLRASGAESERDLPIGVVRQLVTPLVYGGVEAEDTPRGMLAAILEGGGLDQTSEFGPGSLGCFVHGLHATLKRLSATQTVVVVIDDLHWVDEASLRALAFLASRLHGARLLVAVTTPDAVSERALLIQEILDVTGYRLEARAFTADTTAALVAQRFGPDCDPAFAEVCHEVTGGSPKALLALLDRAVHQRLRGQFTEVPRVRELSGALRREQLRALLRRDRVVSAFAIATVILAEQATELLLARLSELTPTECRTAKSVLRRVGGALDEIDGRVVPTAALTKVVSEFIGSAESSRLHRAAADHLAECGAGPEEVAAQLVQVDGMHDRRGLDLLKAAAVSARRRGAPEIAVRYFRRALLDSPPEDGRRAELLVELAATELDAWPAAAKQHLVQAARLLPDHRSRAEALSWMPLRVSGYDPQLAALLKDVRDKIGPTDGLSGHDLDVALRLEARWRQAGMPDRKLVATAGERLRELGFDAGRACPAEQELRVVLLEAVTLTGEVPSTEVARMARQIVARVPANSVQIGSFMQILPAVLLAADQGDAAGSWLDAVLAHARQPSPAAFQSLVQAQCSLALLGRGQVARAKEAALHAVDLVGGDTQEMIVSSAVALGAVAMVTRDVDLARRALEITGSETDLRMYALRRTMRAMLAESAGDHEAALAQILDGGNLLDRAGWRNQAVLPWQCMAAALHHRVGQHAEAMALAEEHQRRALAWGSPNGIARGSHLLGILTPGARGVEHLRQAAELFRQAGNKTELAWTLKRLGKRIQKTSPAEGERVLAQAGQLAEQLMEGRGGAEEGMMASTSQSAVSLDSPVVPAPATRLTPTEATVAELAARGLGNHEIASRLEISRRAVEKHLTSSYRKLGIERRVQLAEALRAPAGTGGSRST
ncbi:AAA family ATPase [Crossiella cryophila]|uniref:DNA-binding CsgD family transcriptional regulator n=1 Tax=Crossiella cryophila TaxID=43355 RepID=A0A7W7FYM6_9PSEU|nr:LuxR family transcriptional regulator [Crossiella cryophila]MBB4680199.1 DNA-binding CsgD family transcriptional regulator [Crossiella cryophila]